MFFGKSNIKKVHILITNLDENCHPVSIMPKNMRKEVLKHLFLQGKKKGAEFQSALILDMT